MPDTAEVDRNLAVPILIGDVAGEANGRDDASIVDRDAQPAVLREQVADRCTCLRHVVGICADSIRNPAGSNDRFYRFRSTLYIEIGDTERSCFIG